MLTSIIVVYNLYIVCKTNFGKLGDSEVQAAEQNLDQEGREEHTGSKTETYS